MIGNMFCTAGQNGKVTDFYAVAKIINNTENLRTLSRDEEKVARFLALTSISCRAAFN